MTIRTTLLVLLLSVNVARAADSRVVAVFPLEALSKVDEVEKSLFDDAVRGAAAEHLTPAGFTVLQKDNLLQVLEDNGYTAEQVAAACEKSCPLAVAQELNAGLFVGGTVARDTDGSLGAFVRLYDGKTGAFLSATDMLEADSFRALRQEFVKIAPDFFKHAVDQLKGPGGDLTLNGDGAAGGDRLARDRAELLRVLPLASVPADQKRKIIEAFKRTHGGPAASELVRAVEPAALRDELCGAFPLTDAGFSLSVQQLDEAGGAMVGEYRAFADGREIGASPGTLKVLACARQVEVRETASGESRKADLSFDAAGRTTWSAVFPRYESHAGGMLDRRNGLLWASGSGEEPYTWSRSAAACAERGEGWRLPTEREYGSLPVQKSFDILGRGAFDDQFAGTRNIGSSEYHHVYMHWTGTASVETGARPGGEAAKSVMCVQHLMKDRQPPALRENTEFVEPATGLLGAVGKYAEFGHGFGPRLGFSFNRFDRPGATADGVTNQFAFTFFLGLFTSNICSGGEDDDWFRNDSPVDPFFRLLGTRLDDAPGVDGEEAESRTDWVAEFGALVHLLTVPPSEARGGFRFFNVAAGLAARRGGGRFDGVAQLSWVIAVPVFSLSLDAHVDLTGPHAFEVRPGATLYFANFN